MDDLPLELWARIFVFSLDSPYDVDYGVRRISPGVAPLLLGRVCRTWRAVSMQTSELWTSLGYFLDERAEEAGALEAVEQWLLRSQGRPLHLYIGIGTSTVASANALLGLCYQQFPRLRTLEVYVGRGLGPYVAPPPGNCPLLEHIHLDFALNDEVAWFEPFFSSGGVLPVLRHLQMREYVNGVDRYLPLERHMASLTSLNVVANNFACHPADVLRLCPTLVKCRLYLRLGPRHRTTPAPTVPFTLPVLRTLWLRSKYEWRDVFEVATFPVLEELELIGTVWPVLSFAAFLQRSQCPLRALTLPATNISDDELVDVLGQVGATLQSLQLGCQYLNQVPDGTLPITGAFIAALDPRLQGVKVLAPRLRRLELLGQGQLGWPDGAFGAMVEARAAATSSDGFARLEEVKLTSDSHVHTRDYAVLKRLKREGLLRVEEMLQGSRPVHARLAAPLQSAIRRFRNRFR